jgi:formate hydrogenlyase transcriptional activator
MSTDMAAEMNTQPEESKNEKEELQRQNDRLQLLLNLTSSITSNLEFRDLLRAISANVREVMQFDMVVIALPDPASEKIICHAPSSQGATRGGSRQVERHARLQRVGMDRF